MINISEIRWKLGMFMCSVYDFMDCYKFLEWSQVENNARTVFYFLFDTYLVEIHEKGEGTHCWLKTNDTEK